MLTSISRLLMKMKMERSMEYDSGDLDYGEDEDEELDEPDAFAQA